jgi:hypothetical protein
MSGNTLNDGMFSVTDGMLSVTFIGPFNLDNRPIVCNVCGAGRGLTFSASAFDRAALVRCPRDHAWKEPRLHGGDIRDLYLKHAR